MELVNTIVSAESATTSAETTTTPIASFTTVATSPELSGLASIVYITTAQLCFLAEFQHNYYLRNHQVDRFLWVTFSRIISSPHFHRNS
jgi:hypothetical protein